MLDKCGREINYIRISVTDRCNLRCSYCIPKEGIQLCSHKELLNFDEIERLVRAFAALGIHTVRLTGGEPFIRRDFLQLAENIKKISGIEKLTVTTNGTFITEEMAESVFNCFDGINISLDTFDRSIYQEITGADMFDKAYSGLRRLLKQNDGRRRMSIKLNCVLTEKNQKDILPLVELAKEQELAVRFIELMPIGLGKGLMKGVNRSIQEPEVRDLIESTYGSLMPDNEIYGNGPAVYYQLEGFQGRIGFISALSHKFCTKCNRIRLTADGRLKTCLQYESGVDLKSILRGGASEEEIRAVIMQAISEKPTGHAFGESMIEKEESRCMSEIGG